MINKPTVRFYNQDGECEAEVETDSLNTFLEFAADYRDANGFIQLVEGDGGRWMVTEPTPQQSTWLQEGKNAANV